MNKKLLLVSILAGQLIFAQQTDVSNVISNFSNTKNISWNLPLHNNQQVPITWHERPSSLSSEGIRTFVGYADDALVGTISIYKNSLQGNVDWEGNNYRISTENGKINITKEENHTCGTCEGGYCSTEEHSHEPHKSGKISPIKNQTFNINQEQFQNTPEIYSDGILRIYRLAILVDYSAYTRWFGRSEINVKSYLAEVETFLNEVYMRDIGVKFVIVNNPELIRTESDKEIFKFSDRDYRGAGNTISSASTKRINTLIGEDNYDIGATVCYLTRDGFNGLGSIHGAHTKKDKANAWAINLVNTMAHEIGHLFGGLHTFSSNVGRDTMQTEPLNGTSMMSYGDRSKRNFFSLPSIETIRLSMLVNAPGYFSDRNRTQKVGYHKERGNAVFGIDTQNKAPRIDRSKIKQEYRLPENTYFQFDIKASDPDGDSLLYMAHQADIIESGASKANFLTKKPSPNSVIPFIPEFEFKGESSTSQVPYSSVYNDTRGEFTFWLGVNDGDNSQENITHERHATQYDMVQTKVKIENGTPFRITGGIESGLNAKIYKAGEKIMLKWGVDKNIFGDNSKVKISLSNDFGKTYKYVLAASTENDGEEEIILPNFEIGEINHTSQMKRAAGILKIEVLDHIAVAITQNDPVLGGFQIKKSEISLLNLPQDQYIKVKENAIPDAPVVTATSTCRNMPNPNVVTTQKENGNIIERTWTATDSCGNTATFTQFIEKEKEVAPLQFVNTPQDLQLACVKDIPKAETLKVTGGTLPIVDFSQSKVNTNQNGTGLIIKRTWSATDADAQGISHSQTILVNDNIPPVLSAYPENKIVKNFSEIRSLVPTLTATDNCGNATRLQLGENYKDNDEQGRTRYYHSWLAVDESGNQTYHEQIFTIDPNYDPTLSISENKAENSGILYPNPAQNYFSLRNMKNIENVKIYNSNGSLVKYFTSSQEKYDISSFISGIYWVVIKSANGQETIKLIKK